MSRQLFAKRTNILRHQLTKSQHSLHRLSNRQYWPTWESDALLSDFLEKKGVSTTRQPDFAPPQPDPRLPRIKPTRAPDFIEADWAASKKSVLDSFQTYVNSMNVFEKQAEDSRTLGDQAMQDLIDKFDAEKEHFLGELEEWREEALEVMSEDQRAEFGQLQLDFEKYVDFLDEQVLSQYDLGGDSGNDMDDENNGPGVPFSKIIQSAKVD